MKLKITLLGAACALTLVSCDNPADTTADAAISEVKEVAEAAIEARAYTFTPASTIGFTGSKVTGSHSGGFKTFTGGFKVIDGMPVSGAFTINMDSTWSDDEKLTGHLKNEDFFNVPSFPQTTFEVTSFEQKSDTLYTVSGNLTMTGKSHNITFPATVEESAEKIKLTSKFDINRQNWGISYAGMQDNLIRDEVIIELNLEAVPAK